MYIRGLIHGDIKPNNILLFNNNIVKLGDFSLSVKKSKVNEKFNFTLKDEDPNEVRTLVQNLVSQTKQLQSELENLKKMMFCTVSFPR